MDASEESAFSMLDQETKQAMESFLSTK
jgi:hypothetical protein